jgi:hypothetical protein
MKTLKSGVPVIPVRDRGTPRLRRIQFSFILSQCCMPAIRLAGFFRFRLCRRFHIGLLQEPGTEICYVVYYNSMPDHRIFCYNSKSENKNTDARTLT